jgi:hypothetical protein
MGVALAMPLKAVLRVLNRRGKQGQDHRRGSSLGLIVGSLADGAAWRPCHVALGLAARDHSFL